MIDIENEVVEFIRRRFKSDSNWLDGNCYYFAVILCERFPIFNIYYAPVAGHFVAGYNGEFYDWRGKYGESEQITKGYRCKIVDNNGNIVYEIPVLLSDIKNEDPAWYRIIVRDCVM